MNNERGNVNMKKYYELIKADSKKIAELVMGSSFTFEGFSIEDNNLKKLISYLKMETEMIDVPIIYYWNGKEFNDMYNLTGSNRYNSDLTFISLSLNNWDKESIGKLISLKIQLGARWLDDIVDNNSWRERETERR